MAEYKKGLPIVQISAGVIETFKVLHHDAALLCTD